MFEVSSSKRVITRASKNALLTSSKSHRHQRPALQYHQCSLSVVRSAHCQAFASSVPNSCHSTPERELSGRISNLMVAVDGKAPILQLKVLSTKNAFPQMQLVGRNGGIQPYLRKTASLNARLCRAKLMFFGQCSQPCASAFLPARDRNLCWLAEGTFFRPYRSCFCLCHCFFFEIFSFL